MLLEIYFDGVLLDPINYMELTQKWVMFDKEFKLGMTPSREFNLTIPKSAFNINTQEVKIKYLGNDYAYLYVDSYRFDESSSIPKAKIVLCDKMMKANTYYDASKIVPCTIRNILLDICSKIGIELGNETFTNEDEVISFYDNTVSARDYISYISELAGGFARIEADGKLWIREFNNNNTKDIITELCEKIVIGQPHEVERVVFDNGLQVFKKARDSRNILLGNSNDFDRDYGLAPLIDELYNGCKVRYYNAKEKESGYIDFAQWNIQPTKFTAGDIFTFSFWAKGDKLEEHGSISTYFYGVSGYATVKVIGSSNGHTSSYYGDGFWAFHNELSNEWKRYWVTYEINPNATEEQLSKVKRPLIRLGFGGELWVCGCSLVKGRNISEYEPTGDLDEYDNLETVYLNPSNVYINTEEQFNNIVNKILGFKYWNIDTGKTFILQTSFTGDVLKLTYENKDYYTIQQIDEIKFLGSWNGSYKLELESQVQQETKIVGLNTQVKAIKIKQNRDENTLTIAVQDIKIIQDETTPDIYNKISANESRITQNDQAINLRVTELDGSLNDKIDGVSDDLDGINTDLNNKIVANTTLIRQIAEAIVSTIKSTGGNNLLRNSVGLAGLDFWEHSGNVTTKQDTYTEQNTVSGSCFVLNGVSSIKQSYITQIGLTYGISFKLRHLINGSVNPVYIRIHRTQEDYDEILVSEDRTTEYTEFQLFNEYTYDANVTNPWIEIVNSGTDVIEISDLIISFGENQSWSGYFDEVYGKEHRLDKYGLKLSDLVTNNFSYLTSTGILFQENGEVVSQLDKSLVMSNAGEFKNKYTVRDLQVVALDDDNIVEYRR